GARPTGVRNRKQFFSDRFLTRRHAGRGVGNPLNSQGISAPFASIARPGSDLARLRRHQNAADRKPLSEEETRQTATRRPGTAARSAKFSGTGRYEAGCVGRRWSAKMLPRREPGRKISGGF